MKKDELNDKAKKEFERLLDECAVEVENLPENPMALDTNLKKQIEIGKKYDKLLSDILKDENNRKI